MPPQREIKIVGEPADEDPVAVELVLVELEPGGVAVEVALTPVGAEPKVLAIPVLEEVSVGVAVAVAFRDDDDDRHHSKWTVLCRRNRLERGYGSCGTGS